jgi:hypothetical protein
MDSFKSFCLIVTHLLVGITFSQPENSSIKAESDGIFDLEISFGSQYNFFVDYGRDLDFENGYILPYEDFPGELAFNQKRAVGTYFNAHLSVRLGGRNFLVIGHTRTLNRGLYNGNITFPTGTLVQVGDFQLDHRTMAYNLSYKRNFGSENQFSAIIGYSYADFRQSELTVWPPANFVEIEQRNGKNSNLEEILYKLGFQYNF